MTRLSRFPRPLALPLALSLACGLAHAAPGWERDGDGVVVHPTQPGAAPVRLQVVDGNILRALRGETIGTLISDEVPA